MLLRRWRYSEAAATIGVGLDSLRELLTYRDAFFHELITSADDVKARDTGS